MASYSLEWKPSAERELRKLPRDVVGRLIDLAESLIGNPFPPGARKLTGSTCAYRVRSGDYRMIYEVHGRTLIIQVVRVGHRRDIYR